MSAASDMLAAYLAAELAVLKGQSYRMGERQLTLADLAEIRKGRDEWQRAVNGENALANRRGSYALADFSRGECWSRD